MDAILSLSNTLRLKVLSFPFRSHLLPSHFLNDNAITPLFALKFRGWRHFLQGVFLSVFIAILDCFRAV